MSPLPPISMVESRSPLLQRPVSSPSSLPMPDGSGASCHQPTSSVIIAAVSDTSSALHLPRRGPSSLSPLARSPPRRSSTCHWKKGRRPQAAAVRAVVAIASIAASISAYGDRVAFRLHVDFCFSEH
ncbi:hypothetical protein HYPSUDRAFT_200567 [Hypholoma sublateritium FD-334 SS-4]|uniref:Uncharacterized protein n=1 Tax=Hypholoma sublateritium (strain FD-334 SS-4) TaxID=945553 RepID=A0A0D2P074_HYPSF|nr:hypothetical protein HYPSUDRAFT_200567 [Hypholoma sublateritium FD-334 SS-4]